MCQEVLSVKKKNKQDWTIKSDGKQLQTGAKEGPRMK